MRNIEDLFKESLKEHELPYNKEAWFKMNKKLDTRNSGSSNGFKWFLCAAGAAIIVSTYLFTGTNEAPEKVQAESRQTEKDESVETNDEIQIKITEQSELEFVNEAVEEDRSVVVPDCCDDDVQEPIGREINVTTISEPLLKQPTHLMPTCSRMPRPTAGVSIRWMPTAIKCASRAAQKWSFRTSYSCFGFKIY